MKPSKFSISAKLFLGFACLLLTFITVDAWSVYQLRRIGHHIRTLNRYQRLNALASQMEVLRLYKKPAWTQFVSQPPKKWEKNLFPRLQFPPLILQLITQHHTRLKRFRHRTKDRTFLKKIQSHLRRLQWLFKRYHTLLNAIFSKTPLTHQKPSRRLQELKKIDQQLGREIRFLVLQMDLRLTQSVLLVEREERYSVWGLLLLTIFSIFISLIVIFLSAIPIRRIRKLVDVTQNIKRGDYLQKVEIPSGDEIGLLAEEFNAMADALHERDLHLAQKRFELEEAYQNLQKSSEKLLRSERLAAIGHLAAQITHEIRNPLNAIGLNLELLEEDLLKLPEPQESLDALRSAMEKIDDLTTITHEYLQFASIPPPELDPCDLNPLLDNLMNFLNEEFLKRELDWSLQLAPKLPLVNVDQRQIRQALLNLLRNAMEAASSSTHGQVDLITQQTPEGVMILIQDNGPGIPIDTQDKIFDPFFSTKEEGSGLGLPLTQQIIIGHGGKISCKSQPNEGTSFEIFLPKAS